MSILITPVYISFIVVLVSLYLTSHLSSGEYINISEVKFLRKSLLNGYDRRVRPLDSKPVNSTKTTVNLYFFLRRINEFNEVSGHLRSSVLIHIRWKDSALAWKPHYKVKQYRDINYGGALEFGLNEIWTPHLVVFNPVEQFIIADVETDYFNVACYPEGDCYYKTSGVIKTSCTPNVESFPFDVHECSIELIIYESLYFAKYIILELSNKDNMKYIFNFTENAQWIITAKTPSVYMHPDRMMVAQYSYSLKRRPDFMLINIVIPVVLLSLINVFVFLIPMDTGDRISFAVTVFLSFTVYMTLITEHVPETSRPMPLWSKFLIFKLTYSTLIILCCIILSRLSRIPKPVPKCIQTILYLTHCKSNKYNVQQGKEPKHHENESLRNISDNNENIESMREKRQRQWREVTNALDRLCLFVFVTITVTVDFCIFGITM